MTATQSKLLPELEVCSNCKQIVLPNDFASHQKAHELTKNFPIMDNGSNDLLKAGAKNAQRK